MPSPFLQLLLESQQSLSEAQSPPYAAQLQIPALQVFVQQSLLTLQPGWFTNP